jgi:hypothetical protein
MLTINRTKQLKTMCGTYATAKHLKALGYPLEIALILLTVTKG